MEDPLANATDSETQTWQESSSTPSDFSQPNNRHGRAPKRRQYQSCDYCRKRRRACNAVRLGINPFTQGQESVKRMACTTCYRANKSCTFHWLLNESKRRPQGVKGQQSSPDRRGATTHDLTRPHARRQYSGSHNRHNQPITATSTDGIASGFSLNREPSSSQQGPSNIQQMLHSGPLRPSRAISSSSSPSIQPDPSLSYISDDELTDSNSEEEDIQPVFSEQWTPCSSSIYDRPLPIHAAQPRSCDESPWISGSFRDVMSNNSEEDQMIAMIGLSEDDVEVEEEDEEEVEGLEWYAGHRTRAHHNRKPEQRYQVDGQVTSTAISSYRGARLVAPEIKLTDTTIKSFFVEGLKKIYENSMETSLSCWLTIQNSPYEKRISSTRDPGSFKTHASVATTLFERAHHLDAVFSVLRPKPLSPTENAAASEALKLAVLAFASQWCSSSASSSQGEGASLGGNLGIDSFLDSGELEYLIRRSLWTQLGNSLSRLSDCDSFRVITAKLILFFVTRPLNREEKDLMEEMISRDYDPSNSQDEALAEHDVDDCDNRTESTSERPWTSRSAKPQTLFELLDVENQADHLKTVMQQLSSWSTRIKVFLQRTASTGTTANIPLLKQVRHVRQRVLQACPQFNILFWFAVMLDTARSTLHRRPLILLDQETESRIVKHSSDERTLAGSILRKQMEISESHLEIVTSTSEQPEIWWPLQQKPLSACDDPFEQPRFNFDDRMRNVLEESTPMTVLLLRKGAHLQQAIVSQASEEEIERCIAEILNVYGNWDFRFRQFLNNCLAEHSTLPFKIRSWYITVFGHWLVGYLRSTELISEYDTNTNSNSIQRAVRLSTSLILRLQKESAYTLAEMSRVSCLDGSINSFDRSNREYHSSIRPGSVLTDPAPDIMIFGMKSACDAMLSWLRILRVSDGSPDIRNTWVHGNVSADDLIRHIQSCVSAMNQLGRLSPFAEINAKVYNRRLEDLKKASRADVKSQMVRDTRPSIGEDM